MPARRHTFLRARTIRPIHAFSRMKFLYNHPMDNDPPRNVLNYGNDASGFDRQMRAAGRLAVYGALAWAIFILAFVFIVARFERIFADFKTELPGLTKLVINVSGNWIAWAVLWMILLMPALLRLIVPMGAGDRDHSRAAHFAFVLLVAGLIILIILGLFMPMLDLFTAISTPGK
jgi:hypothetical protein